MILHIFYNWPKVYNRLYIQDNECGSCSCFSLPFFIKNSIIQGVSFNVGRLNLIIQWVLFNVGRLNSIIQGVLFNVSQSESNCRACIYSKPYKHFITDTHPNWTGFNYHNNGMYLDDDSCITLLFSLFKHSLLSEIVFILFSAKICGNYYSITITGYDL